MLFSVVIFLLFTISLSSINTRAVTVDLIHRNSPRSPYYDPSLTLDAWLAQATSHSHARARYIGQLLSRRRSRNSAMPPILHLSPTSWYVVNTLVGAPPVSLYFVADTGSSLIWTQCEPCNSCYPQEQPIYDPKNSSSYDPYPCPANNCTDSMFKLPTSCQSSACRFMIGYAGGQGVSGIFSRETFTLGSTAFKDVLFGCASKASAGFGSLDQGLLGLGNAPMGFAHSPGVDGKFATCLPQYDDPNAMGTMLLGDIGDAAGTVSTPMVNPDGLFYMIRLERTLVGETGGVITCNFTAIVDTGCMHTYMPMQFVVDLDTRLRLSIQFEKIPSPDIHHHFCYLVPAGAAKPDLPHLTFKFGGGVNLTLPPETAFHWLVNDTVLCLVFHAKPRFGDDIFIWGASVMTNFLVGYDLTTKTMNFTPMNCDDY